MLSGFLELVISPVEGTSGIASTQWFELPGFS